MQTIAYELKYCEGCGALKLRPLQSAGTNCRCCETTLAGFPLRHKGRGKNAGTLGGADRMSTPVTASAGASAMAGRAQ